VVSSIVGVGGCVRLQPPDMAPAAHESCRSTTVQWFGPDDLHDRARLDAWCAGVGPAIVETATALQENTTAQPDATTPLPEATTGASAVTLNDVTFVSWNVHVGNGDLAAFIADLRAGVLTDGKPVRHFVLMLQEAVRARDVPPYAAGASGARRITARTSHPLDIFDISRDLGLSLIYVPSMRNGESAQESSADRGNAIVSTLRLSDPIAVELPGERQRRVAIFAKLWLPNQDASSCSVGVVHLDALGTSKRLWLFGTTFLRELQVKALAPVFPETDLVVGADLNTWHGKREPASRFLEKLFGTPVSMHRDGAGIRVLDYLFFRLGPNLTAHGMVAANDYGSDHHALVAQVVSSSSP
jgi:hypothetical protein